MTVGKRTRILAFAEYYLPGYKAGGPVQSLAGLARGLGSEIDFYIVTRDRDFGDSQPYSIASGEWQEFGYGNVRYLDESTFDRRLVYSLLREINPDVVYLAGYFGPMTRTVLASRRWATHWPARTIVHPQGQFARGALGLKPFKKRCYLLAARMLRLAAGVEWQASSTYERDEIRRKIGSSAFVHVVSDVFTPICAAIPPNSEPKQPGHARLLYLSRITPVKNLLFLLRLLPQVPGRIDLTIAGPVDDEAYGRQCRAEIANLPPRIRVRHDGPQPHDQVLDLMAAHDFFVLPTLGENFGHAVVEALQAGLPVVVSDKTPWRDLEQVGSGWDLPLESRVWVRALERCVDMDRNQHEQLRLGARCYVSHILSVGLEQNRAMFMSKSFAHERSVPLTALSYGAK